MTMASLKFPKKVRAKSRVAWEKFAFPKKADGKKLSGFDGPENILQEQVNDLLNQQGHKYYRFENWFMAWMRLKAPAHVAKHFFDQWRGEPDNQVITPIGNGLRLVLCLELKAAKGATHGKQKTNARAESWSICRSIEDVITQLELFNLKAKELSCEKSGTEDTPHP